MDNDEESDIGIMIPLISFTATVVTIAMFLSPWRTVQEIRQKNSVGTISATPFISSLLNCILWVTYGLVVNNKVVGGVNAVGVVTSTYYIITYWSYTSPATRGTLQRNLGIALGAAVVLYLYIFFVIEEDLRAKTLGLMGSVVSLWMFASPLEQMSVVVRTRSTESMIFALSLMSLLCALSWTIFGHMIQDKYVFIPNLLATILSLIQLSLFLVYPRNPTSILPTTISHEKIVDDYEVNEKAKENL